MLRKTIIAIIILFQMAFFLISCMTTNQLVAEQSYYQMQAKIKAAEMKVEEERIRAHARQYDNLSAMKTLEIKTVDPTKPIVLENVEITAYALPQIPQQPIIINSGENKQIGQYVQRDYISPWTSLLGKIAGIAIPAYAAYKIIDSVGSNAGEHTHMNNYGANSQQSIVGDTNISGATTGGNINLHSDFTHDPLVVNPLVVDPVIVDPVIVDPVIVDPVIVTP